MTTHVLQFHNPTDRRWYNIKSMADHMEAINILKFFNESYPSKHFRIRKQVNREFLKKVKPTSKTVKISGRAKVRKLERAIILLHEKVKERVSPRDVKNHAVVKINRDGSQTTLLKQASYSQANQMYQACQQTDPFGNYVILHVRKTL